MRKSITTIIIFICLIALLPWQKAFSFAMPIELAEWRDDFQSKRSIDSNRSSIEWQEGQISLQKEGDNYAYSGVLWTNEISFRQDIYSLTLDGARDLPAGTSIRGFISFDKDNKEYSLVWGSAFYPENRLRKFKIKIFLATNNQIFSPKLYDLYVKAELMDRSEDGPSKRDNQRVSDLKKTRDIVQKYYNDFNKYPIVKIDKEDKEGQWRLLRNILESASINHYPDYIRGFISQKSGVDTDYQYGYLTDSSGGDYLLWTKLEETNSKHFNEIWSGEIFNVNCSAPIFCLSSQEINPEPERLFQNFDEDEDEGENTIEENNDKDNNESFIYQKNDSRVWLQINNHRLWLRTLKIFEKVGGLWDKISLKVNIDKIPLIKFLKKENDPRVYLVSDSGLKRHIPNPDILKVYGSFSEIIMTGKNIIDSLPNNYLIRGKGEIKVYLLEQNIKRWITTPSVLKKLGFDFSQVVEIDSQELDYYAEGQPIF